MVTKSQDNMEYEEIGRVRISDTTEAMVSMMSKNGEVTGILIGKYITSKHYTGPTAGVFIPNDKIADFAKIINQIGV